jgi:glycyl-tRNA synthetase beta subunit
MTQVDSAAEYRQVLQRHRIELSPERRGAAIWAAVAAAASRAGGMVPESSGADLLPEVTNLVESPTAVLGTFDEAFLRLPRSATVTAILLTAWPSPP